MIGMYGMAGDGTRQFPGFAPDWMTLTFGVLFLCLFVCFVWRDYPAWVLQCVVGLFLVDLAISVSCFPTSADYIDVMTPIFLKVMLLTYVFQGFRGIRDHKANLSSAL